ncbi:hypothetical protein CALVIDRAFT_380763 [Calocera viscosa TUFC12733]|uniref:AttH domain-containing protein n=1 Tax=Calocera viscosa (strain TUFC12733) TaxID=1330018 RepID=A0A167Q5C3_CALVF|nr:hypothetical protein CALVIDRAFT_380763 [Calocera viscosa TUFC12733]
MFRPLLRLLRLPFIVLPELLAVLLDLLLPRSLSRRLLPQEDHYAPHASAGFEGWYTRVALEGGGNVVCIVCHVREAEGERPAYVHFSYTPGPAEGKALGKCVYDMFPPRIEQALLPRSEGSPHQPFALLAPGYAEFSRSEEGISAYFHLPGGLYAKLTIGELEPLKEGVGEELTTPEGRWARLGEGLPLHWHVLTLGGRAGLEIWRTRVEEEGEGKVGLLLRAEGVAHCEKNWGLTFPRGWIWSQAFSTNKDSSPGASFALAGGKILGQRAHMVLFRSPSTGRKWDFRPPWTLLLFGKGVTIAEHVDKEANELLLEVCDLSRKLVIRVRAQEPREAWLPVHCPLRVGHRIFASETFTAAATVDASERRGALWSGRWEWVETRQFADVAFELGGDYR